MWNLRKPLSRLKKPNQFYLKGFINLPNPKVKTFFKLTGFEDPPIPRLHQLK